MTTSNFASASVIARRVLGLGLVLSAFAGSAMALEVPEIDPSSIGSAMTLLAGGLFLFKNRRAAK